MLFYFPPHAWRLCVEPLCSRSNANVKPHFCDLFFNSRNTDSSSEPEEIQLVVKNTLKVFLSLFFPSPRQISLLDPFPNCSFHFLLHCFFLKDAYVLFWKWRFTSSCALRTNRAVKLHNLSYTSKQTPNRSWVSIVGFTVGFNKTKCQFENKKQKTSVDLNKNKTVITTRDVDRSVTTRQQFSADAHFLWLLCFMFVFLLNGIVLMLYSQETSVLRRRTSGKSLRERERERHVRTGLSSYRAGVSNSFSPWGGAHWYYRYRRAGCKQ